jgi:hypothetical protein
VKPSSPGFRRRLSSERPGKILPMRVTGFMIDHPCSIRQAA